MNQIQKHYWDLQENLFLFLDDSTIPPTNNQSEQALLWSMIFRKVMTYLAGIFLMFCRFSQPTPSITRNTPTS